MAHVSIVLFFLLFFLLLPVFSLFFPIPSLLVLCFPVLILFESASLTHSGDQDQGNNFVLEGTRDMPVAEAVWLGLHPHSLLPPPLPQKEQIRESMVIIWEESAYVCSLRRTVWTVLPDPKLPPESSLLAMLCALVSFQHLDIPSLVAWSQPLGQNAVIFEGNQESTLYASTFYIYVQFAYVLFTLAISALPFKTALSYSDQSISILETFLGFCPHKPWASGYVTHLIFAIQ